MNSHHPLRYLQLIHIQSQCCLRYQIAHKHTKQEVCKRSKLHPHSLSENDSRVHLATLITQSTFNCTPTNPAKSDSVTQWSSPRTCMFRHPTPHAQSRSGYQAFCRTNLGSPILEALRIPISIRREHHNAVYLRVLETPVPVSK